MDVELGVTTLSLVICIGIFLLIITKGLQVNLSTNQQKIATAHVELVLLCDTLVAAFLNLDNP